MTMTMMTMTMMCQLVTIDGILPWTYTMQRWLPRRQSRRMWQMTSGLQHSNEKGAGVNRALFLPLNKIKANTPANMLVEAQSCPDFNESSDAWEKYTPWCRPQETGTDATNGGTRRRYFMSTSYRRYP
jgi:hypothetical protein